MHLLYLNSKKIRLLSFKKDLFKQVKIDFFSKEYSTKLLQEGNIYNIDILASAVKEATSNVFQSQKAPKDLLFILPSPPFFTKRITLPLDIHEQAIRSFITQKIISLYPYKDLEFFFTLHQLKDKRLAVVYSLEKKNLEALNEVAKILDLNFKGAVPENFALFKLFEKTLSKTKEENIWYVHAERKEKIEAESYFYDNYGPLEEKRLEFTAEDLEDFKKKILEQKEKRKVKYNRFILAGNLSLQIRQDTLTKEIGIWVNPLPKILESFYKDEMKKIIDQDPKLFLKYDSHFSLLTHPDLPNLSLKKKTYPIEVSKKRRKIPNIKPFLFPFTASLLLTLGVIFGIKQLKNKNISLPKNLVKKSTPSPSPTRHPTPTPTPEIKKEELKIKILNGSGIKGQAAKLSTYLKDKGYKEIVVGNADSFDYEKTIIKLKEEYLKNTILKDISTLTQKPKIEKIKKEDLPEDIIIIIGKDLELQ